MEKQIETKIVILPLELGRGVAGKISGKTFKCLNDMENAIRSAYDETEKDETSIDVESLIDELGVYSIDEFVCQLNDKIYPADMWVASVFIEL